MNFYISAIVIFAGCKISISVRYIGKNSYRSIDISVPKSKKYYYLLFLFVFSCFKCMPVVFFFVTNKKNQLKAIWLIFGDIIMIKKEMLVRNIIFLVWIFFFLASYHMMTTNRLNFPITFTHIIFSLFQTLFQIIILFAGFQHTHNKDWRKDSWAGFKFTDRT